MADVYFTYFSAWDFVICLCCCRPKGFLLCHEINWLLFCSSLRFVACMCLCLFLLGQALFRYKLAFILFRVTYLFVVCIGLCLLLFQQGWPKGFCSSLRTRWLFAYTLICFLFEQAQKASALLRVCNLLLLCSFYIFLYSFHCLYFEQALKASALSQDLSGFILVLVVSCLLFP